MYVFQADNCQPDNREDTLKERENIVQLPIAKTENSDVLVTYSVFEHVTISSYSPNKSF